jgi:hypothetical protein
MNKQRGLVTILAALLVATLGCSGCNDKSKASAADAGADASAKDGSAEGGPSAVDAGPSPDDLTMPAPANEELAARMRHLLEALAQNNPDLAADLMFPRDAYIATRDTADPQKAWEKKVSGLFRRSIERTHKRNKGIESAKFVGFELGHTVVQLAPKKHDFKRPLWRVKHSRLTFTIDGKMKHVDIAEMTAWRGAWYITRIR